jgi:hypothetical protein
MFTKELIDREHFGISNNSNDSVLNVPDTIQTISLSFITKDFDLNEQDETHFSVKLNTCTGHLCTETLQREKLQ